MIEGEGLITLPLDPILTFAFHSHLVLQSQTLLPKFRLYFLSIMKIQGVSKRALQLWKFI